jgi:hypothetical protein
MADISSIWSTIESCLLPDRQKPINIFEQFCAAREAGTDFLVRTCVDRLAGRGGTTIARKMALPQLW